MGSSSDGGGDLEAVRGRLRRWRSRHGGRGRRLPEALWDEAAMVAQVEGVAEVARALRLDRHRLAQRVEGGLGGTRPEGTPSTTFVELGGAELHGLERSAIEVENAYGERLRIEVSGRVDVAALVHGFRSRGG